MLRFRWTGPRAAGCCASLLSMIMVTAVVGCDDAPAPPAPPIVDQALECVPDGVDAGRPPGQDDLTCEASEICLRGRCFPVCDTDADCGPRETCASSGACIPTGGPSLDSGTPFDAGPPDPCDGVTCEEPLVCHALSGSCVECNEAAILEPPGAPGRCSGLRPLCDIANGVCVDANPAQCSPCTIDAECQNTTTGFMGVCLAREIMDVRELVCMTPCADTDPRCPSGLECDIDEGICVPTAGVSCTTWVTGTQHTSCLTDEDCNPLGASAAFFPGACDGAVFPTPPDAGPVDGGGLDAGPVDAGSPIPGRCLQPCGIDTDCQVPTDTCQGDGFMTFCAPPPPPV